MTRFVLIGTGWRAMFYVRVAAFLPSSFSIQSVYTRSPFQKSHMDELGMNAFTSLDMALSVEHDAVIVSSGEEGFYEMLMELDRRGETILAETSFLGLEDEMLKDLESVKGYVLEQWQFTPRFQSILSSLDLIGPCDQVMISYLHNHHAASIARRVLNIKDEVPSLVKADHVYTCARTASRKGRDESGQLEECTRKIRILDFGKKGIFINDFTTNQYHNFLYDSHIEIRGERGTLTEKGVTYLDKDSRPIRNELVFHRDIDASNASLSLSHVSLGDRVVFTNPYYGLNMNDDEIAIARMLNDFSDGKLEYTIMEGIRDARIGKLL